MAVANPTVPAAIWMGAGEPVLLCLTDLASLVTISEDPGRLGIKASQTNFALLGDLKPFFIGQRCKAGTASGIVTQMILI